MVIRYTAFDVELSYLVIFPFPGLFTYPVNVQEFLRDLIPGLPYPGLFPFTVSFFPCNIYLSYQIFYTQACIFV